MSAFIYGHNLLLQSKRQPNGRLKGTEKWTSAKCFRTAQIRIRCVLNNRLGRRCAPAWLNRRAWRHLLCRRRRRWLLVHTLIAGSNADAIFRDCKYSFWFLNVCCTCRCENRMSNGLSADSATCVNVLKISDNQPTLPHQLFCDWGQVFIYMATIFSSNFHHVGLGLLA